MTKLIKGVIAMPLGFILGVLAIVPIAIVLPFYCCIKAYNKVVFSEKRRQTSDLRHEK